MEDKSMPQANAHITTPPLPRADLEQNLGSINPSFSDLSFCASQEPHLDQTFWAAGCGDDRELADDSTEAGEEDTQHGAV